MNNACRVNVFESSKNLIKKILDVFNLEFLFRFNDTIKISLHQLTYQVDISKDLSILNLLNLHLPFFWHINDVF